MVSTRQYRVWIVGINPPAATAALAVAITFVLAVAATQTMHAQTYTVIHSFTGGVDGGKPWAGLTLDQAGNLYGTAMTGGAHYSGSVFKLSHGVSGWVFTSLYNFGTSPSNQPAGVTEEVLYQGITYCVNTRYCPDFVFWGYFPPGYVTLTHGGKPVVYLWVDFTGLLTFESIPLNVPPPRGLPLLGTLEDNGMLQEVDQFFPGGENRTLFVLYKGSQP